MLEPSSELQERNKELRRVLDDLADVGKAGMQQHLTNHEKFTWAKCQKKLSGMLLDALTRYHSRIQGIGRDGLQSPTMEHVRNSQESRRSSATP